MPAYVALLRAVNVGGTGRLPMTELKAMGETAGFANVRTYIASGNLVFSSGLGEHAVRAAIEARLEAYAGKPVGVLVRTAAEMAGTIVANPFADRPGNRTVSLFVDAPLSTDTLAAARNIQDEELHLGERCIYIFYGNGMAVSRLAIPAAKAGTARNMNTVAKLAQMAEAFSR